MMKSLTLGTESMGEVVVLSENVARIIMGMKSPYKWLQLLLPIKVQFWLRWITTLGMIPGQLLSLWTFSSEYKKKKFGKFFTCLLLRDLKGALWNKPCSLQQVVLFIKQDYSILLEGELHKNQTKLKSWWAALHNQIKICNYFKTKPRIQNVVFHQTIMWRTQ